MANPVSTRVADSKVEHQSPMQVINPVADLLAYQLAKMKLDLSALGVLNSCVQGSKSTQITVIVCN